MKKKYTHEEGIVLIEAIIAVAVLATMFAAAMALFTTSVTGVRISSDQLVATFLAQDAMEQVIAKITHNIDNFVEPWTDGLAPCISGGGTAKCEMNYYANAITSSASGCSSCPVLYNSTTGVYSNISGGSASGFTRSTSIEYSSGDHEAFVDVTVTWQDGPATLSYTLYYVIYDPTPLYDGD